ncbi:MAG: NAD-dependent epimerase/dehydratase family protein [Chloroflexota bacterium]|nr:NAD-dependent epimerase/dehydratase family protein [Chloroflexota bacterium]
MRVIVTGCAGFLGSHLSEEFIAQGHEVVGVDCFTDYYSRSAKEANLVRLREEPRFSLVEADLCTMDLESLVEGTDLIYHQAAQAGVRASWGAYFETYVRNNVVATQRLLEAVKGQSLKKFVYASSSSVYGDAESYPTSESVLPCPVSPYGVTKLGGEQLVYLYHRNYGVPTVALRYFTVYGPRQRPDMAFHKFIRWALEGKPIQIYGDGEQSRDFTFVSDAVAANVAAGISDATGVALNIGGGSQVTVNEVIGILEELLDMDIRVDYASSQRGDVRHTSADTSLAASLIGYEPRVDLRAGLAQEARWVRRAHFQSTERPVVSVRKPEAAMAVGA